MKTYINAAKRRAQASAAELATAGKAVAVGSALVMASGAHAAAFTMDTADIVATIAAGVVAVSAIGTAAVSLVVVVKLFKWVRSAL